MDDGPGEWTWGLACRLTVACKEEERERQSGMAAAGRLPEAPCSEAGGLRGGTAVVDEERLLSRLVCPVLEEHPASPLPPLDRGA